MISTGILPVLYRYYYRFTLKASQPPTRMIREMDLDGKIHDGRS